MDSKILVVTLYPRGRLDLVIFVISTFVLLSLGIVTTLTQNNDNYRSGIIFTKITMSN